jgi:DNA-binding response OmpR family regulator
MSLPVSILIVEDDPAMLRGLMDTFSRDGYHVATACDGHSAVETALDGTREPDVILLDLMLPGIDGLAVCRRLRKEGYEKSILILTARGQETDIVRGLEAGADDYLAKPFGLDELRARIQALLRRQRRSHQPSVQFGTCQWDPAACQLKKDNQEVSLTPQERELLAYFLANPGRALTRDTLLRAVSKRSLLTTTRTIDQAVKNLRHRIEPNPHQPVHLLAVREVGYLFKL